MVIFFNRQNYASGRNRMEYICPVCGTRMERELDLIIPHMEAHIVDAIKKKKPSWVAPDGTCKKCYEHYKNEMKKK
jgi:hypothetical protein